MLYNLKTQTERHVLICLKNMVLDKLASVMMNRIFKRVENVKEN